MKYFLKDMRERAIKTFIETLLATVGVVIAIDKVPWITVVIVSIGSTLLSMLSSVCSKYATGKDSASLVKQEENLI